jgi:hypothetical protein
MSRYACIGQLLFQVLPILWGFFGDFLRRVAWRFAQQRAGLVSNKALQLLHAWRGVVGWLRAGSTSTQVHGPSSFHSGTHMGIFKISKSFKACKP